MLSSRRKAARTRRWSIPVNPSGAPAWAEPARLDDAGHSLAPATLAGAPHPLANERQNQQLFEYEKRVKDAFDNIVPVLKQVSALQHEEDFEERAQELARQQLGIELPGQTLSDAWVDQLDMRGLYAWCMFETYRRFSDDFFSRQEIPTDEDFQSFLLRCGFHTMDVSPCADGRLAHVISYVLRLPYREVRRKSYAGAMFDIEDSLEKWIETEFFRYREGRPDTADKPTRYLKAVVYHFSSGDPEREGCAAHGSDTRRAAESGRERLYAFQQAVENSFCCGASIDLLLIGLDTDTDSIRIHVADENGEIDLNTFVDTGKVYTATSSMNADQAMRMVEKTVREAGRGAMPGMIDLVCRLVTNNISQLEYVRRNYRGAYPDIGHAERFIGVGIGFEEIQIRNLTYFAYMNTVEEGAADLDVGVKIFTGLNVSHGLPVPVVIRFDYHGHVPGARERAAASCRRVAEALEARYEELVKKGLLHTLQAIRDCAAGERIEVLASSVYAQSSVGAH